MAVAFGAVDKVLGDGARGAGVFLLGHSAGCELALRMATARDDVIGVELAGTGLRYSDPRQGHHREATLTSPTGRRGCAICCGSRPSSIRAEVLTGALSAPGVAYEARGDGELGAAGLSRDRRAA